jgi:hypothetical protein
VKARAMEMAQAQAKPDPKAGPRSHRGDLHPAIAGKLSGTCERALAGSTTSLHSACYSTSCNCRCHLGGR